MSTNHFFKQSISILAGQICVPVSQSHTESWNLISTPQRPQAFLNCCNSFPAYHSRTLPSPILARLRYGSHVQTIFHALDLPRFMYFVSDVLILLLRLSFFKAGIAARPFAAAIICHRLSMSPRQTVFGHHTHASQ